jgi:hypothetical protein
VLTYGVSVNLLYGCERFMLYSYLRDGRTANGRTANGA